MKRGLMWFFICLITSMVACENLGPGGPDSSLTNEETMMSVKVSSIRYTQNTVSPEFTDGTNINSVREKLKSNLLTPASFPPIKVLTAKEHGEDVYFSLDNRRLYVFKNSNFADATITVAKATPEEAIAAVWKLTSTSDGTTIDVTNTPDKASRPAPHSLLGKIREKIELEIKKRGLTSCPSNLALADDQETNVTLSELTTDSHQLDLGDPSSAHLVAQPNPNSAFALSCGASHDSRDANPKAKAELEAQKAVRASVDEARKSGLEAAKIAGKVASRALSGAFAGVGFVAGMVPGIIEAVTDKHASPEKKAALVTESVPVAGAITATILAKKEGKSDAEAARTFFATLFGVDVDWSVNKDSCLRFGARFGYFPSTCTCYVEQGEDRCFKDF